MKENLIELLSSIQDEGRAYGADVTAILSNSQIADYLIANGVTVREKGEWEIRIDDYDCEYAMCSVCCSVFYDGENDTFDIRPNFCPDCGADMRGDT